MDSARDASERETYREEREERVQVRSLQRADGKVKPKLHKPPLNFFFVEALKKH